MSVDAGEGSPEGVLVQTPPISGVDDRQGSRAGKHSRRKPRPWRLEQWGLRPKVAVVVAFPLVVAVVLGSLRLSVEVRDAIELADAAKHVDGLNAVVATEAAATVVAGRKAAGTLVAADLMELDSAVSKLDAVRREPGMPPDARDAMGRMHDAADRLRATGQADSMEGMIEAEHTAARAADAIVESVLRPIKSVEVINHKNRLLDVWAAQRELFAVAVGLVRVIRNPSDPGVELDAAIGAERVLLDRLGRYFPVDDPRIVALRRAAAAETPLIDKVRAAIPAGPIAVRDVGYGDSLVKDQLIYAQLVDEAAKTIASGVAAHVSQSRTAAIRDSVLLFATLVIGMAMAVLVARALLRPLRRLHDSARRVAEVDLPDEVDRINANRPGEVVSFTPIPVDSAEEIGQVARAVDDIHGQALRLADRQRRLRGMVDDTFDALARRTKTLLDRQLQLLESLEEHEDDPERLANLFQLDHLATRMRRNGDNLMVLAGTQAPRGRPGPVLIGDVLQAAMSEVEQYHRIRVASTPAVAVKGDAAVDVVHLIAELLDNALRASPPHTHVTFECKRSRDGGLILEIIDEGIGISQDDLVVLNDRLSSTPEIEPETARRMGLFVVGRLAERHGVTVVLQPSSTPGSETGTVAVVDIPPLLIRSTRTLAVTV